MTLIPLGFRRSTAFEIDVCPRDCRFAPHPAAATFSPLAGRRGHVATSPFPTGLSQGTSPRPVYGERVRVRGSHARQPDSRGSGLDPRIHSRLHQHRAWIPGSRPGTTEVLGRVSAKLPDGRPLARRRRLSSPSTVARFSRGFLLPERAAGDRSMLDISQPASPRKR